MRFSYEQAMEYLTTKGDVAKREGWSYQKLIHYEEKRGFVQHGDMFTPLDADKMATDWVVYRRL